MSEDNDSSQEKSEEPTEKRLKESREKGQVARSKELSGTVILLVGGIVLVMTGQSILHNILLIFKQNFSASREVIFDHNLIMQNLAMAIKNTGFSLLPLLFLLSVAAIASTVVAGGWTFSISSLAPKFSRMDPIKGIKKIFSLKGLMEMMKAMAKFLMVGCFSIMILYSLRDEIVQLSKEQSDLAIEHGLSLVLWIFISLSSSLILIAAIDVPFQIWQHNKQLKMTKQQVKDEYKDTEGKPEVKARIRQMQREIARQRMMGQVAEADVVITNPTHYSVALKYAQMDMGAPVLLGKGADLVAFRIRDLAKDNDIAIVESPELARAIFYNTELDQEIPAGLYLAVAQILAYVYQLNQHATGNAKKPESKPIVEVPEDLRHE